MKTIIAILLIALSLLAEIGPEDLTYMTEDYPPNNYVDEYGILQGFAVLLIREIWKEMECPEQKITVYPWARAYLNIQSRPRQVLFTMSHTESRDSLFKWLGPISTSEIVLVGKRSNSGKIAITNLSETSRYKTGVIRSDVGEQMLINKGVSEKNFTKYPDMQSMIISLQKGDIEIICIGIEAFNEIKKTSGQTFYKLFTVEKSLDYIAFSKDVPDSLILKFQKALEAIRPRHLELLDSMNMELNY